MRVLLSLLLCMFDCHHLGAASGCIVDGLVFVVLVRRLFVLKINIF